MRKIPWKRKGLLTPVFLPEKSHGPRSLAGYSPWGCTESDMTKHAGTRVHTHTQICTPTYIYTHYICYKELGHVIIEAEKPQVLQGRAGNPKES